MPNKRAKRAVRPWIWLIWAILIGLLAPGCARTPEERARFFYEYQRGSEMTYGTRGSIQRYDQGQAPCRQWAVTGPIITCLD